MASAKPARPWLDGPDAGGVKDDGVVASALIERAEHRREDLLGRGCPQGAIAATDLPRARSRRARSARATSSRNRAFS